MKRTFYKLRHFDPREVIAPRIHKVCGDDALKMYDPQVLEWADLTRDVFGPMICNTWHSDKLITRYGLHRFRGMRPVDCPVGAKLSCHKLGIVRLSEYSGIDLVPLDVSVQFIHESMKKDQKYWSKYISRIEKVKPNGRPITWLHGDSKPHTPNKIYFFKP